MNVEYQTHSGTHSNHCFYALECGTVLSRMMLSDPRNVEALRSTPSPTPVATSRDRLLAPAFLNKLTLMAFLV